MKNCAYFIADHGVEVDRLFTDHWKLDQADEAYREFDKQAGGRRPRVLITVQRADAEPQLGLAWPSGG
jgi:hypothetical protein